jgi:tRNA G26 N,N-dimethylase Trm1
MVSMILAISSVSRVDFPIIVVLFHGPLVMRLKKSRPGFRSLNAYVSDCEQINHHFGPFYDDLLHSLDVIDSVMEDVDDLDVLDIQDSVTGVV